MLLADGLQRAAVIGVECHAALSRGGVDLARWIEGVARQAILSRDVGGKGDSKSVFSDLRLRGALVGDRIFARRQIVRGVDHVAGVSARRAVGDLARLQEHDLVAGPKLAQAPRRREAGEAGTDDQPVRRDVAVEHPDGEVASADRLPTRGSGFRRKTLDDEIAHRMVSSTERSETSIQTVFSSQ